MSTFNHRIDLGHVDVSRLTSEEDFHREARRLVPNVLVQLGEAAGETAWQELQRGFKGIPGFKPNSSSSDRRSFIREAGENYRRKASEGDKRKLEEHIAQQLKDHKKGGQ